MRNREFYEEELEALKSIDSTPEGIRSVEQQIQALEDKQAQAKLDKLEGITGTGLNNQEKHQLKELKGLRRRIERKEELEVLVNMNGIEEFTQEAENPRAQEETLDMVKLMVRSNAAKAAHDAKKATTAEPGKSFKGKIPQREGYYVTEVPGYLTKTGEISARKDQMSKNSLLGASIQVAILEKLATRDDLTDKQRAMISKLITYYNKVIDRFMEEDKAFGEGVKAQEEAKEAEEHDDQENRETDEADREVEEVKDEIERPDSPSLDDDERREDGEEPKAQEGEKREDPNKSKEEEGLTVVEEAKGIKGLIAKFIKVLQTITNNPNLLENARKSMYTQTIKPYLTTVPEGTKPVKQEDDKPKPWELAPEVKEETQRKQAEVAKEVLESQEQAQAQVDPQTKTVDPATKDGDELGG